MKLLHTSDLHLGRQFNGISLEEDHAAVLDQNIFGRIDIVVRLSPSASMKPTRKSR